MSIEDPGFELALDHLIGYGKELGRSIPATPEEIRGVQRAAHRLWQILMDLRGITEQEEYESEYKEYLKKWQRSQRTYEH